MKTIALALVALSSVAACATHSTKDLAIAKSEGRGMTAVFAGGCDKHWPRVRSTVERLGLDTMEEHAPHELLTSYQKRGEVGGSFVGVWLEEKNAQCEIRVVSMRRDDQVPSDNDWDARFFTDYRASR